MAPYYPELHDEKKVHRQIAGLINKFEEWGIIKKVRDKDEALPDRANYRKNYLGKLNEVKPPTKSSRTGRGNGGRRCLSLS